MFSGSCLLHLCKPPCLPPIQKIGGIELQNLRKEVLKSGLKVKGREKSEAWPENGADETHTHFIPQTYQPTEFPPLAKLCVGAED